MTREEAIKELEELRNEWSRHIYSEGIRKRTSLDMAIKALEQESKEEELEELLESLQKANATNAKLIKLLEDKQKSPKRKEWISVEEDAPPKGIICLWCNKQGNVFTSAITSRTEKSSYVGQHGYFSNGLKNHGNIVAWMPLPEPYKADMRGSDDEAD